MSRSRGPRPPVGTARRGPPDAAGYVVHGHPFVRQQPVRGLFPRPVRKDGRQPRAGTGPPFPSHGNNPVADATVGMGRARVLPLRPVGPFVGVQRHRRRRRAFGFAAKGPAPSVEGKQPHATARPDVPAAGPRCGRGGAASRRPHPTTVMPRAGVGAGHHRAHPVALPPVFGHAPGGRAQPCGWWQAIIASRRRRSRSPDTGRD